MIGDGKESGYAHLALCRVEVANVILDSVEDQKRKLLLDALDAQLLASINYDFLNRLGKRRK
jgi:hypothetical protein